MRIGLIIPTPIFLALIPCILPLQTQASNIFQKNAEASKTYQQMEQKLTQAKSVKCTVDLQAKFGFKELSFNGELLVGDRDRYRLQLKGKVTGEEDLKEFCSFSNGFGLAIRTGERQPTFFKSPKNVGQNWKFSLARSGISLPMITMNDANGIDTSKHFAVNGFRLGKAGTVAGKMALPVHYILKQGNDPTALNVTLWIDPKTHLPLKRVIGLNGKQPDFFSCTEMYSKWSLGGKIPSAVFDTAAETHYATLSSDGKYFAESTGYGTTIYEVKTGKVRKKLGTEAAVAGLRFSPDSKYLATGQHTVVRLWDWRKRKILGSWKGKNRWAFGIAFSADSTILAVTDDNSLRVWSTQTRNELLNTRLPYEMDSLACSPDGKLVAVAGSDAQEKGKRYNEIKVWTVSDRKLQCVLKGADASLVRSLAFSPDGKRMASGLGNNSVRLWDIESKKVLWNQKVESTNYETLAFSPNGKQLAAGGLQSVSLLDAANGKIVKEYQMPGGHIKSVTTTAKDGYLLLSKWDRVVSLDLASGKQEVLFVSKHRPVVNDGSK